MKIGRLCVKGLVLLLALYGAGNVMLGHLFNGASPSDEDSVFMEVGDEIRPTDPMDVPELAVLSRHRDRSDMTNDVWGCYCYELLGRPKGKSRSVRFDLSVLDELVEKRRDVLLRYLATNPSWKLYRDGRCGLTARKRIRRGCGWFDDDSYSIGLGRDLGSRSAYCELRVVIAFDGKIGWSGYAGFSDMNAAVGMGEEQKVPVVKVDDEQFVSQVTVKGEHVLVGFDEVQECTDNRFTAASVACLRKEFSDLMAAKDWDSVMRLMPSGTVSDEGNLLRVYHNGIGTYQCFIRVNPGEEGVVHIRVADPKTGCHLRMTETHRPTIRTRTNEYVGWSADTNETFFASSGFTMYDGAYCKPSPVNVEVWFTPNAGDSERKLIEQSFNLEAWER